MEDDDTEWEKFQARLSKREKVLEGRSKQSHSVHCPFYPEVSVKYLVLLTLLKIILVVFVVTCLKQITVGSFMNHSRVSLYLPHTVIIETIIFVQKYYRTNRNIGGFT